MSRATEDGSLKVPREFREIELEEKVASMQRSAVCAIHQVLALRDAEIGSHNALVAELCTHLAEQMDLEESEASALEAAALVHDIGMISLPDGLLSKQGPLSADEQALLGNHPESGWSILRQLPGLDAAALIVLHHHERFDGTGYPAGLRGEDIPLGARILAVLDAFAAMISNRPHRPAVSAEVAIQELIVESGKQFDPTVVRTFVHHRQRFLGTKPMESPPATSPIDQRQSLQAAPQRSPEHFSEDLIDGKYRIVSRLGSGGMGEVYIAVHIYLNTSRVIKVISPQHHHDPEAHSRFIREARLATRVDHPNVARLYEFGRLPDGSMYMVSEFINGSSLAERIQASGPVCVPEAIRLTIHALRGLHALHQAGIVHRDISPENLMVARSESGEDRIVIIDLGVAKSLIKQGDEQSDELTNASMFLGKPRYASPEQFGLLPRGETIDLRTDLYSMAAVVFELLTGRPLLADSFQNIAVQHFNGEAEKRAVLPPDVPGAACLGPVLSRALRRDRGQRYASALEFADALETALKVAGPIEVPIGTPLTPPSIQSQQPTQRIV